jgi:hypothetical protein
MFFALLDAISFKLRMTHETIEGPCISFYLRRIRVWLRWIDGKDSKHANPVPGTTINEAVTGWL